MVNYTNNELRSRRKIERHLLDSFKSSTQYNSDIELWKKYGPIQVINLKKYFIIQILGGVRFSSLARNIFFCGSIIWCRCLSGFKNASCHTKNRVE